ncbi:MAG: glycosyltransferase [Actinomycetota bacterium]|nr:glycosyltransferase [Actinomycetota bacterium]
MSVGFSIITPSLNSAATIAATLASVRSQCSADVEHLVIDGGSTDGTLEILARTPGVRWISEPDRGLSHAMNKGIGMARGDVIGWLNADDIYLPDALERVSDAFDSRPDARWLTGRCIIIDAHGAEIRRPVTAYKWGLLRRYGFGLHLTHNFVSSPSTFVRRGAFDEVGLFDERFRYSMDYDLWLRLGRMQPPIVLDGRPLAAFRMAQGSLSMSEFERQFDEHAQNAREHGAGHAVPVGANAVLSRGIVVAYRAMRALRRVSATS